MSVLLVSPVWSMYEGYVSQVLKRFAEKVSKDNRPVIVNSYPYGILERLKNNNAVIHIYTDTVVRSNMMQTQYYKQDTFTFIVDVYTAPTEQSSLVQGNTQEELAYKLGLCYSNWVRSVILDLSVCSPIIQDPNTHKKVSITSNLRWLECDNIVDTNNYEIAIACQRQKFSVELPYYPTDSNEYIELKQVLTEFKLKEDKVGNS